MQTTLSRPCGTRGRSVLRTTSGALPSSDCDARHPGFIRFSRDIELIGIGPCGRADDLLRMHVISELDQVVEGSVQSVEYAAWIYSDPLARTVRIRRLDGSHLELRLGVRIH